MFIWNKNREEKITYETYLIALRALREIHWGLNIKSQTESIIAQGICDSYKKQNRFNLFLKFDEMYRPFIKYGKLSSFLSKSTILSLFWYILIMIMMIVTSVMEYEKNMLYTLAIVSSTIFLFGSLFPLMYYRDKYDIEKEKYQQEKSKPGWERKQKFKRLMKEIN